MNEVWMVIDKMWMSVFGVYDSEEKALNCINNLDIIKGSKYYIEKQVLR